MLRKLSMLFFLVGLLGFISFLIELELLMSLLPLTVMAISFYVIKESQPTSKDNVENSIKESSSIKENIILKPELKVTIDGKSNNKNDKSFIFRVVGISKLNDEGKDIQKEIRKYVVSEIEMNDYSYDCMTNKEILEYGDDVYEVDLSGSYEIELELEPNNSYDPNAIKVIHKEIGHIGYVPKEFTSQVKTFINNDCKIQWQLLGGKLKYIDWDEDKVKTKTLSYGMEIILNY